MYGLQTCYRPDSQSTNNELTYPKAAPIVQDSGPIAIARDILVSSLISASIHFITPTLPFSAPAKNRLLRKHHGMSVSQSRIREEHYLAASAQNVRDKPNMRVVTTSPSVPLRRTGLRPIKSERRLHCNMVTASPTK